MYTIANGGSNTLFFGSYEIAPGFSKNISDTEYDSIAKDFTNGVPNIQGLTVTHTLELEDDQALVTDGDSLELDVGSVDFTVADGVLSGEYHEPA
jgi:hypothetical protein